jgi:hypothetical protein
MPKKKIVYLFGAGATQGEVSYVDSSMSLLTRDVVEGMIKKISALNIKLLADVKNELTAKSDVEHLITLYDNVGTAKHTAVAKKLKELFRKEILDTFKVFEERNSSFFPLLTSVVIDMHEVSSVDEEIAGIITLNYDDIAERAIQKVKKGIDYSITTTATKSTDFEIQRGADFSLLKLHGSFNWKRDYPVQVSDPWKINEMDVLWIPPGIEKKRDQYPFSVLWATAREILRCDTLRIIGCSLNRNDIQLISLIFSMQKINPKNKFTIEIIDYVEVGDQIKSKYPYLKTSSILEIPEVKSYLVEFFSIKDTEDSASALKELVSNANPKVNIFERWLRAKGNQVKNRSGKSISTPSGLFEKFINERV